MLVSIIIPIYNTGEKLRRCLDSILRQTYKYYECLMVDDGSKNDTANICDEYATYDKRFIAIHKNNGGVSSARNAGLEIAKGEWICFVDSDDYLMPNHISSLVSAVAEGIDIVVCGYENANERNRTTHTYINKLYKGKKSICRFFNETDFLWYMIPWDRMFRAEIINKNGVRFNLNLSISEDRLFCYDYLQFVEGIATTDAVTYYHDTTNENSLSHRSVPLEIQIQRFMLLSHYKRILMKEYDMTKADRVTLNTYSETLLVQMQKAANRLFFPLPVLKSDPILVIKLLIKQLLGKKGF